MSATDPHPFRVAAEAHDADALVATLAPDVVLHSPVTFHPYVGREAVGGVLQMVADAFEDWHCIAELHDSPGIVAFVFRARAGQRELEGVDLLRLNADGLVADLTVMIRPLSGLIALAQAIGPRADAAGLKPSRGTPA
jgi:hypothetical protein